tara:strand:- start:118 stop:447 length:330 start_codon:yes stop_codon:yes gene_type:complete
MTWFVSTPTVIGDVTQQSDVLQVEYTQAPALAQSDLRNMLSVIHKSEEKAVPVPSVSAHVGLVALTVLSKPRLATHIQKPRSELNVEKKRAAFCRLVTSVIFLILLFEI